MINKGDSWDHRALDPEHRLVVAVVPGARTVENTEALVAEFRRRTAGPLMALMTSDDYPAYETAILYAEDETQGAEGPHDVPVLEGLALPRGGHLPESVQRQLLLAGVDATPMFTTSL
jgi:hypothetical protein